MQIALYLGAFLIFCFVILSESSGKNNKGQVDTIELIFLVVLLAFILPQIVMSINTILKGDVYKFQKQGARIVKNKEPWFKFRETTGVLIKHQYNSEKEQYTYELYLVSVGEHQYWLDESRDLEQIKFIAELIAETLSVKVSSVFE